MDWFTISGGIRVKAAWETKGFSARYVGLYWGEPMFITLEESTN